MSENLKYDILQNTGDIALSQYVNSGYKKLAGRSKNSYTVPNNNAAFGNVVNVQLQPKGHFISWATVEIGISAISGLSGGTFNRFINRLGCNIFDRIEIEKNGEKLQIRYGHELDNYFMLMTPQEDRYATMELLGHGSTTQRNALAAAAQKLVMKIPFFCNNNIPIMATGQINVDFYLKPLNELIQTDHNTGAASVTINYFRVNVEYTDNQACYDYVRKMINDGKFKFHAHNIVRVTQSIPSGSTDYQIMLQSLQSKHIEWMVFNVRTASDLAAGNSVNPVNHQAINQFYLASGSQKIGSDFDLTDRYNRFEQIPKQFGFPLDSEFFLSNNNFVYVYSWTTDVLSESENDSYSGSEYINLNDLSLNINFSSSLAAASQVVVYAVSSEIFYVNSDGLHKL